MSKRLKWKPLRRWWSLLLLVILGGYWLLPLSGQVIVMPGGGTRTMLWPQMRLDPPAPRPGETVRLRITDVEPWTHVLLTVNSWPIRPGTQVASDGLWAWEWTFVPPEVETKSYTLVFYRDCHLGCVERGRMVVGGIGEGGPPPPRWPTKLGVIFANPSRDWHDRSGWDVELTYVRLAGEEYWGIDDLAARVHQATAKGLRVLVRVDYDQGQSLPPANDHLALTEYLQYIQRLARDDRLQSVYGYLIGSGYNALGSNSQATEQPVTPEWYARLFNGYGKVVAHTDNVVQMARAVNPRVRVLVGPVQPWNADQNGERQFEIDAPWLNYMNTLVAALDESARAKAAAGIPLTAPDGFALQAPGRPGAPELAGRNVAEEPRLDLRRAEWGGAQVGFRVYRDWLAIVNAYPSTRGLPVYITSTNTFTPDEVIPPAQNYAKGWLTAALEAVNEEPQVKALCWFLDYFPHDTQWEWFSLTRQPGRMIDAAEEFDMLLQSEP